MGKLGPTFREVVAVAFAEAMAETEATKPKGAVQGSVDPSLLASELQAGLKRAGYSIHRSGECVHPRTRRDELGRPMTPEEQERLLGGLLGADPAT